MFVIFLHFFTLHSTLQQMDFVHLSALENRNYGGDFLTPQMQRIVECSSASAYVSMRQRKSAYV